VVALRTSKWPKPVAPEVADAKGQVVVGWEALKNALSPGRWHFYQMALGADGRFQLWEDGLLLGEATLPPLPGGALSVRFGGFKGYVDDLHVQKGMLAEQKSTVK